MKTGVMVIWIFLEANTSGAVTLLIFNQFCPDLLSTNNILAAKGWILLKLKIWGILDTAEIQLYI